MMHIFCLFAFAFAYCVFLIFVFSFLCATFSGKIKMYINIVLSLPDCDPDRLV